MRGGLLPAAKWYEARSYILGMNWHTRDIARGLLLARACRNQPGCEEADWICSVADPLGDTNGQSDTLLANKLITILSRRVMDGRTRFFVAVLKGRETGMSVVKEAAELGYPFAMALYARFLYREGLKEVAKSLALQAADAGEPEAMYVLSVCGFFNDVASKELAMRAAMLGDVSAQTLVLSYFDDREPEHWFWRCRVGTFIDSWSFVQAVSAIMRRKHCSRAHFQIGWWCHTERANLHSVPFPVQVQVFLPALEHWKAWCDAARNAVNTWLLCALRLNVSRDMRRVIGQLIWDLRDQWEGEAGFIESDQATLPVLLQPPHMQ